MANEQNLKPWKSVEEAREKGRKGGIRSGEAKREKKILKDEILKRMNESDWEDMCKRLIARAKNNDRAFELFRDTIRTETNRKSREYCKFIL